MSSFPCLARFMSGSGQVRYRLVNRYLEFVAGRCRPNTLVRPGEFGGRYVCELLVSLPVSSA
jgi:hypothetical protein